MFYTEKFLVKQLKIWYATQNVVSLNRLAIEDLEISLVFLLADA